ncbi:hypothetical protein GCM10009765_57070 [Fodinicola feengrottensis]|uniref:Integral membrane protein n=3 Tax=Fodinicola feengrottensis TaxID=435914 RepID=A0ABP4UAM0_9ACTN
MGNMVERRRVGVVLTSVSLGLYVVGGICVLALWFFVSIFASDSCGTGGAADSRPYCQGGAAQSYVLFGPAMVWIIGIVLGVAAIIWQWRRGGLGWIGAVAAWVLFGISLAIAFQYAL